jgi:hypothetical protein
MPLSLKANHTSFHPSTSSMDAKNKSLFFKQAGT